MLHKARSAVCHAHTRMHVNFAAPERETNADLENHPHLQELLVLHKVEGVEHIHPQVSRQHQAVSHQLRHCHLGITGRTNKQTNKQKCVVIFVHMKVRRLRDVLDRTKCYAPRNCAWAEELRTRKKTKPSTLIEDPDFHSLPYVQHDFKKQPTRSCSPSFLFLFVAHSSHRRGNVVEGVRSVESTVLRVPNHRRRQVVKAAHVCHLMNTHTRARAAHNTQHASTSGLSQAGWGQRGN